MNQKLIDEMHEELESTAPQDDPTKTKLWKRVYSSPEYQYANIKKNELIDAGCNAKIRFRYEKKMYDVVQEVM